MRAIPIAEVTEIGQSAVATLNRRGIITVSDLLGAEPGDLAYLLDSQSEAERVLRAARRAVGSDDKKTPPHPDAETSTRREAGGTRPKAPKTARSALGDAMALLDWTCPDDAARIAAMERLWAVTTILEHGGSESEAAAVLGQPTVAGGEAPGGAAARLGADAAELLDEVARVQGMPTAPIGRPREVWEATVQRSSPAARRVCAASAVAALKAARALATVEGDRVWSRFQGGRDFALWYYRALAAALDPEGSDALVSDLVALVDAFERGQVQTPRRAAA